MKYTAEYKDELDISQQSEGKDLDYVLDNIGKANNCQLPITGIFCSLLAEISHKKLTKRYIPVKESRSDGIWADAKGRKDFSNKYSQLHSKH